MRDDEKGDLDKELSSLQEDVQIRVQEIFEDVQVLVQEIFDTFKSKAADAERKAKEAEERYEEARKLQKSQYGEVIQDIFKEPKDDLQRKMAKSTLFGIISTFAAAALSLSLTISTESGLETNVEDDLLDGVEGLQRSIADVLKRRATSSEHGGILTLKLKRYGSTKDYEKKWIAELDDRIRSRDSVRLKTDDIAPDKLARFVGDALSKKLSYNRRPRQ